MDLQLGVAKRRHHRCFHCLTLKRGVNSGLKVSYDNDIDDLESSTPGKRDIVNYTKAGNIANYLQILEIEHMYLPVPVNFIFIGFDGKGNQDFKLDSEELQRWFTKIDHIFEHTKIPQIGEVLAPFFKISINEEQRHHLPLISHINYNFSVHAIQMGEKVTEVFERAIDVLARKDDVSDIRDDAAVLWQVDLDMMDVLFSSLVEYLQLENTYNIFILNPLRVPGRAKYGYRRGLSDYEINFLKENKSLQEKILHSGSIPESFLVTLHLFFMDMANVSAISYVLRATDCQLWTNSEDLCMKSIQWQSFPGQ